MANKAMSLRVEGLRDLQKDLRAVDRALPRELRVFNKEAAETVGDEAQRRAPVGPTGRLANKGITVRASQRDASLKIGTASRVPYAGPVIGGYGPPRPQGGFNLPNPFPFEALSAKSKELRKIYDKGINKLVKRLSR